MRPEPLSDEEIRDYAEHGSPGAQAMAWEIMVSRGLVRVWDEWGGKE